MRLTRLLLPLLALSLPLAACSDGRDLSAPPAPVVAATVETTTFGSSLGVDLNAAGWTKTTTGLYYRVLSTPTGTTGTPAVAANGQRVNVRYTGWLSTGSQFESSTYAFTLGTGNVIAGWDQGIVGMRVGERRRLLIPPSLGYGPGGNGPIPGNSVLVFDVELLSAT
jgi:FKBP-type peptidyl-prolyl cis-trans isomerase